MLLQVIRTQRRLSALKVEAGKLAQKQGYSADEVSQVYDLMDLYASNSPPFNQQPLAPSAYWVNVHGSQVTAVSRTTGHAADKGLLVSLALRLLEAKPTATTVEQVRNLKGRWHELGLDKGQDRTLVCLFPQTTCRAE